MPANCAAYSIFNALTTKNLSNFARMRRNVIGFLLLFFAGCSVQKVQQATVQLKFLSSYTIPFQQQFRGTTIGGLSGVDYDAASGNYFLICDDASNINPARFYTAKILISNYKIDSVFFTHTQVLKQPDGKAFATSEVDPEALRFSAADSLLYWCSEGVKNTDGDKMVLKNPFIWRARLNGSYVDSFCLPTNLYMQNAERGPRNNGSFEGLTFDSDKKHLYASVEEPLYQDGARATPASGAWVRIIKFDVRSGRQVAQYAYKIDAVAEWPQPLDAFKINGISDILGLQKNRLLVMERSFSSGQKGCVIKIYEAGLKNATDVSTIASLQQKSNYRPATKTLLLNMQSLNMRVHNVEGMTFGPVLDNGNKTLVMVADDNFSATEATQFFLFEILPAP